MAKRGRQQGPHVGDCGVARFSMCRYVNINICYYDAVTMEVMYGSRQLPCLPTLRVTMGWCLSPGMLPTRMILRAGLSLFVQLQTRDKIDKMELAVPFDSKTIDRI